MDITSVAPAPRPDTRELRALALYREHGAEIVRTGSHTYLVPSCAGHGAYAVDLVAESCDCRDFEVRRENCKHILAAAVKRAKRRGTTARRLAALEEMHRHEILSEEERCELRDRILRIRGGRS